MRGGAHRLGRGSVNDKHSDTELTVILDVLADAAERLRGRTEALAASGIHQASRRWTTHQCRTTTR